MGSIAPWRPRRLADSPAEFAARAAAWLVFWAAAVWAATKLGTRVEASPGLALAPAGVIAVALVSARFPLAVLFAVALLSGMYATVEAQFGLRPYLILHVLLAGLWIAALQALVARRGELRPRLWLGPVLLLTLAGASLIWVVLDADVLGALGAWRNIYWAMLAALLVAFAPFESASAHRLTRLLLVAVAGISGYAFLRWQIGASTKEAELATQVAGPFTYLGGKLRPIGGVGDAHALSSVIAPIVPFSLALLLTLRDRWRLLAGVVAAASGAVLVASGVRAGMVAAGAGVVVVLVATAAASSLGGRRIAATYLGVMLCVAAVGTAIVFESGGFSEESKRFDAILTPGGDPAFQERIFVWQNALAQIDQRPFGRGLGTGDAAVKRRFSTTADSFNGDVVNSYLRVALEQGTVFALALLLSLLTLLVALVRQAVLATSAEGSMLAIAAAGTLTTFAIHLNFESIYIALATATLSWLIIGLGMRQLSWRGRQPGQPPKGAGPRRSPRSAQNAGLGRPRAEPAAASTP